MGGQRCIPGVRRGRNHRRHGGGRHGGQQIVDEHLSLKAEDVAEAFSYAALLERRLLLPKAASGC
jgi:hypothetical protein